MKVNRHLPVIETTADAKLRSQTEVADRAIALMLVSLKGEGLSQLEVVKARDEHGAAAFLSPEERAFIDDPRPKTADRTKFSWRYECLGVMEWALGYAPALSRPSTVVDAGAVVKVVTSKGHQGFRAQARLRSVAEVLDEADLIYRYDWACVDARIHGGKDPAGLDCGVVVERHQSLNWLIGYMGQAWDDVGTDT